MSLILTENELKSVFDTLDAQQEPLISSTREPEEVDFELLEELIKSPVYEREIKSLLEILETETFEDDQ